MIFMAEADAFMSSTTDLSPGLLTKCPSWTAHELLAHLAAGAVEIARNVEAYNSGGALAVPPPKRSRNARLHFIP